MVLSNSFSGFLKLVCLWLFFTSPFFIGLKWPAKGGCKEPFKWGEQGEKSEICQITQELDWKVVAATHPNLKFLVQLVVNMYGGGQERVTTLSVYSLQQNVLEAQSWFGKAFHWGGVGNRNWWNYEHRIFWFTMWKASDMQLIHLTFLNDLKHTANVKKKNTIKHYQSWMASPQPEPDHYWSQHPKKSFVCSSRGSKKYSWKLLNALIRKLS